MTEVQRYEMRRYISDDMVKLSEGRVITEYMRGDMELAFKKLAKEHGFPAGAKPLWRLSWEYEDDGDRND